MPVRIERGLLAEECPPKTTCADTALEWDFIACQQCPPVHSVGQTASRIPSRIAGDGGPALDQNLHRCRPDLRKCMLLKVVLASKFASRLLRRPPIPKRPERPRGIPSAAGPVRDRFCALTDRKNPATPKRCGVLRCPAESPFRQKATAKGGAKSRCYWDPDFCSRSRRFFLSSSNFSLMIFSASEIVFPALLSGSSCR
jgi:hypothetical protein